MKQSSTKKKFLIIDGTAQVYRAFYAIKPLTDSQGEPVNAVFGFTTMILSLLKQVKPSHIVVAFDRPEPTFRHQLYPEYKAQRQAPPEDLIKQIPIIKNVVRAFQLNICEQAGLEADDIISTLAVQAAKDKAEVLIVTSDKDLFQIVDEHINIMRPVRGGKGEYERLDPVGVEKTFGVRPGQIPDVLALMGDISDNIPGVPGVGAKTAVELIANHGSLHDLYQNLDEIQRVKLKEKLLKHQADAIQSYELVQVVKNAKLNVDWQTCTMLSQVPDAARELMATLRFKRLSAALGSLTESLATPTGIDIDNVGTPTPSAPAATWTIGMELENDISALCQSAGKNQELAIEVIENQLVMAAHTKTALQLSLQQQSLSELLEAYPLILACLENKDIKKISYNYKAIMIACYELRKKPQGPVSDLHLAAHLLDLPSNSVIRFVERLLGQGLENNRPGLMACALIQLSKTIESKLKHEQVWKVYTDVEIPLLPVLAAMEWSGVAIDVPALKKMAAQFGKQLDELAKNIQETAGMEFNIRSPQQLADVLFDKLNLASGKKTKTGRSTSVEVLESLAQAHPLPAKVLEYRKLQKIKSTYLDVLPELISEKDKRLHTTFNQVGAATGRLSSTYPNLQNIPVRSDVGRKIRAMFIPEKREAQLLSADYSQIELRLLAHLSEDKQMIKDFKQGLDIHQAMASEIFNVPLEDVTVDMRRQAKTCNFGIAYGVSPFGLAKQIGVSNYRAKEFIDGFYSRYPGVRRYLDNLLAQARKDGFVTTLLGRKRNTPDIHSANRNIREAGERMAINTPIQGSAADLIKLAMINISQALQQNKFKSRMILQVHDELLFEGPIEEMPDLQTIVVKIMSRVYPLSVALIVDTAYGNSWLEAHG